MSQHNAGHIDGPGVDDAFIVPRFGILQPPRERAVQLDVHTVVPLPERRNSMAEQLSKSLF
ncbi:hypothetical protein V7793_26130 [Streptomyces sp. KLMMK]|uniref:hypothetical protein n=1 Tax=Streptomyces sp. KLMMK TaxID=3109353 RepID=UPI00300A07BB